MSVWTKSGKLTGLIFWSTHVLIWPELVGAVHWQDMGVGGVLLAREKACQAFRPLSPVRSMMKRLDICHLHYLLVTLLSVFLPLSAYLEADAWTAFFETILVISWMFWWETEKKKLQGERVHISTDFLCIIYHGQAFMFVADSWKRFHYVHNQDAESNEFMLSLISLCPGSQNMPLPIVGRSSPLSCYHINIPLHECKMFIPDDSSNRPINN